ncbi:DUF2938 domain-containing protein [Sneathiella chinensis]|nr:DUF2938 domain-containing protein [Sneathiella chinensis]
MMDFWVRAVSIGIGATLIMDMWAVFLKQVFHIPSLDWAMVGRWIGHFPRGRFFHAGIGTAELIAGERAIGWIAHYGIGIAFAAGLLALMGVEWSYQPTVVPAIAFGVVTVAAPFLVMQPGFGFGIAASKTPAPNTARVRSLMAHTSFGVGLYAATLAVSILIPVGSAA